MKKQSKLANIDLYTRARSAVIIPEWIHKRIGVYNGKSYIPVTIRMNMIGHKLGEYSFTTIPAVFVSKTAAKGAQKGAKGGTKASAPKGK